MRGISEIIEVILVLIITISLIFFVYQWSFSSTSATQQNIQKNLAQTQGCLKIENIDLTNKKITIRDCGENDLSNFVVYIDSSPIAYYSGTLSAGAIMQISYAKNISFGDHDIKVSSDYAEAPFIVFYNPPPYTCNFCIYQNMTSFKMNESDKLYCLDEDIQVENQSIGWSSATDDLGFAMCRGPGLGSYAPPFGTCDSGVAKVKIGCDNPAWMMAFPEPYRTLLKYNLSSISSGKNIQSAILYLEVIPPSVGGGNCLIGIYNSSQNWEPSTVTWLTMPSLDTLQDSVPPISDGFISWDVTNAVKAAHDAGKNVSFILKYLDENCPTCSGGGEEDFFPMLMPGYLVITYDSVYASSDVHNVTLNCQGHSINCSYLTDSYGNHLNPYGIYWTGSGVKNNTIKNCNINNCKNGIYLANGTNNNNLINNIVNNNNNGIYLSSSSQNILTDNIVNNNNLGFAIFNSSDNNIIGGSVWNNTYDYYLNYSGTTNKFINTNFTAARTIYFGDASSWFNYNNETTGNIWLKTNVSAQATITRKLVNWNQTLIKWNDTASASITATYNITGLLTNTKYNIYDNLVPISGSPLNSDSSGQISFTIILPANQEHEIKIEKYTFQIDFFSPTPSDGNVTSNNFVYVNVSIVHSLNTSSFIDWNRSLVGYWAMDWYNSTGIFDNSTYNNFGTFNGANFGTSNITTGKYGNALNFNGVNDYVNVSDSQSLNISGPSFTLSAWIYLKGYSWNSQGYNLISPIITRSGDAYTPNQGKGYGLLINDYMSPPHTLGLDLGWGSGIKSDLVPSLNQWHFVAVSHYNQTFSRFMLDNQVEDCILGVSCYYNVNDSQVPGLYIPTVTPVNLEIGRNSWAWGGLVFNGTIDEVRIWNRALSPEEINASYNSGIYRLYHNFTNLSNGVFQYYAYAIDTAGNANRTETRSVTHAT